MVGLDSEGQPNPVVGGKDLMMFSSIVGVDGSAQLPTAHHSPARNLLFSHQNLVEPWSDVVSMRKFGSSSYGVANIERFPLLE